MVTHCQGNYASLNGIGNLICVGIAGFAEGVCRRSYHVLPVIGIVNAHVCSRATVQERSFQNLSASLPEVETSKITPQGSFEFSRFCSLAQLALSLGGLLYLPASGRGPWPSRTVYSLGRSGRPYVPTCDLGCSPHDNGFCSAGSVELSRLSRLLERLYELRFSRVISQICPGFHCGELHQPLLDLMQPYSCFYPSFRSVPVFFSPRNEEQGKFLKHEWLQGWLHPSNI